MRFDSTIMELAREQHGVVARAQLLAAGISSAAVDRRLRGGLLRTMHAGVYQVGPIASPLARQQAAILACGAAALLSHYTAAALWQLPGLARTGVEVDVIIGSHERRRRAGIRAHAQLVGPDEATRLHGLPVTTLPRTLLDVAAVVSGPELERLLAHALRQGLLRGDAVRRQLARRPRHAGAGALRELVRQGAEPALTRSEAEARLLALLRRTRLPAPGTNQRVRGYEVDFLWRTARLVVEVDGFAFHRSAHSFEHDRRRDAALTAAGLRVIRVTWRQIVAQPEQVLVDIAQALMQCGAAAV